MAHGSNEVNVSAPSTAMIFLLNPIFENLSFQNFIVINFLILLLMLFEK
jgi:hypothetical protein